MYQANLDSFFFTRLNELPSMLDLEFASGLIYFQQKVNVKVFYDSFHGSHVID